MRTILFADDDRGIRQFCRQEFEEEGYRVLVAGDGHEAVRLIQQGPPDLVVLDLHMPRLGGLATAEQIKRRVPHVPIVFFTQHGAQGQRGAGAGLADACLEKDADLTALKQTVEALLGAGREASRAGMA